MPSRSSRRIFGDGPLTHLLSTKADAHPPHRYRREPEEPRRDVERRLVAEETDGDRRRRHAENESQDDRGHEERGCLGDLLASDQ